MTKKKLNILTVDLEDWLFSSREIIKRKEFLTKENYDISFSRARESTTKLLKLFDHTEVKATFFVLGKFAERYPEIIKKIQEHGHEIGSHGYNHELVYNLTPKEFEKDLEKSLYILRSIIHEEVFSYRAPYFSITPKSQWAFEILNNYNIIYDSSIFPIKRKLYGFPSFPLLPTKIDLNNGKSIIEVPVSVIKIWRLNFPIGGGGYWRILPVNLLIRALKNINQQKRPAVVYMHPYEIDAKELKYYEGISYSVKLLQGLGRRGFISKLQTILKYFTFTSIKDFFDHENEIPGYLSQHI